MVSNMFFRLYMNYIKYLSLHQYKYSIFNSIAYFIHKRKVRNDINYILATQNFMDVVLEFVYFFIYYNRQMGDYYNSYTDGDTKVSFTENDHTHSIKSFTYSHTTEGVVTITIEGMASDHRQLREEYSVNVSVLGFDGKGITFYIQYNYDDSGAEDPDYFVSPDNFDTMLMVEKTITDNMDNILNRIYTEKALKVVERSGKIDTRQPATAN